MKNLEFRLVSSKSPGDVSLASLALGFGIWIWDSVGFGIWDLDLGFGIWDLGFGIWGWGLVEGLGLGFGIGIWHLGFGI